MKKVYRLIKKRFAADPLSPDGARLFGGRWNSKGVAMVYASDSISLAVLEILVHLHRHEALEGFVLCEIPLPDGATMELAQEALPENWRHDPPPFSTMAIGDEWIARRESLALAVPSTIIPQQSNLLINPHHDQFKALEKEVKVETFPLDGRLMPS